MKPVVLLFLCSLSYTIANPGIYFYAFFPLNPDHFSGLVLFKLIYDGLTVLHHSCPLVKSVRLINDNPAQHKLVVPTCLHVYFQKQTLVFLGCKIKIVFQLVFKYRYLNSFLFFFLKFAILKRQRKEAVVIFLFTLTDIGFTHVQLMDGFKNGAV